MMTGMLPGPATERIYFPPFELNLATGRLLRGSEPVDISPKAFGVLRHLAERAGRLVSKEELIESVWPGVHVGETVLVEANSATDNPMVFADTGDIVSGGNFHAEPVAFAADTLAASVVTAVRALETSV